MGNEYKQSDDYMQMNNSEGKHRVDSSDSFSAEKKQLTGYEATPSEKENGSDPYQISSIANAYNNISIGSNDKGVLTVAMSAKKRYNSNTIENDRKSVQGTRQRRKPVYNGEFVTNTHSPKDSAFAYRAGRKMSEKRIFGQLKENAERYDLDTVNESAPFFTLEKDSEMLNSMRESGENDSQSVAQRLALEKTIADKKRLQFRFINELKSARKKASANEKSLIENVLSSASKLAQDIGDDDEENNEKNQKKSNKKAKKDE